MAKELRHPLTRDVYGIDSETGLVRVTQADGRTGLYGWSGEWRSGEEFDVDPCFCVWVGGPRAEEKYDKPFKSV